ncbi:MAG TPA: hypothetical protein VN549_04315 [Negativicutes bacterium]|nr:hypothetical protein [Negativicutes bacterium]
MTLVDIRNAAAQRLSAEFPDYCLYYDVLPQNYSIPGFLVQISSVTKTMGNVNQYERTVVVSIRYYPADGTGIGILEMQEGLENLFDTGLQAGDRNINVQGTKGETIEAVLHFSFDLSYTDSREDMSEGLETMKTLEMKEEF